jgi:hypothetical protein
MPDPHGDATRAALERIAQDGSDLSQPLEMDFFVAVPDERTGRIAAARANGLGFGTSVEQDEETGGWTCYCSKVLVPTYEVVVAIELQLESIGRDIGGYVDGFGTFGNAAKDPSEDPEDPRTDTDRG